MLLWTWSILYYSDRVRIQSVVSSTKNVSGNDVFHLNFPLTNGMHREWFSPVYVTCRILLLQLWKDRYKKNIPHMICHGNRECHLTFCISDRDMRAENKTSPFRYLKSREWLWVSSQFVLLLFFFFNEMIMW